MNPDQAKLLGFHRSMLADRTRTEAHRHAIFETVKPGDVVLDIGTGTGVLAFFACQAGARRVYAVEMGEVVELAKLLCLNNGFKDRVTFIHGLSTRVELPERVDVLMTDIGGTFALQAGPLDLLIDARTRFLKDGGAIIPRSIELFVVPVELPEIYEREVEFWARDLYGLDLSPIRPFAVNNLSRADLSAEACLGDPAPLLRVDLAGLRDAAVRGDVLLVARRSGVLHGLGGWFVGDLAPGVSLTNGPEEPAADWPQVLFPLEQPLTVKEGDRVTVEVSTYNGGEWRWRVEVAEVGARFDQSTLRGFPFSLERLHNLATDHAPVLSRLGEAEAFLLRSFDGRRTVTEMGQDVFHRYSDVFKRPSEAEAFVREVVARCG